MQLFIEYEKEQDVWQQQQQLQAYEVPTVTLGKPEIESVIRGVVVVFCVCGGQKFRQIQLDVTAKRT